MDDTIVISYEFVLFRLKEFSAGNYPLSRQTSSISTEELGLCGEIPSLIFIRWKEGGRLKEFSAGNYPLSRQTSSISTEELGLCGEILSYFLY